jgi:hypothetical protein
MAKEYSTISIEGVSLSQVTALLHQELGVQFTGGRSLRTMGVYLDVYDAPPEFTQGFEGSAEETLDEERFFREVDVSTFGIFIDLYCPMETVISDYLHVFADAVARVLSKGLDKRTLVFFEGTHTPFRLYEGGETSCDFSKYYKKYMQNRKWVPLC